MVQRNIAYFIDRDSTIVTKQGWYQAEQMEKTVIDYLKVCGS
jgi:hypothetical protein